MHRPWIQESGLFNLGQGECTTNLHRPWIQEFGLFNLGQGEYPYNRLAREKVAKAKQDEEEKEKEMIRY